MDAYPNVSGVGLEQGPVCDVLLGSQSLQSPAAGADFTFTVPDVGSVYEVVAIRARLVTSAAVANRLVHCVVKDAASNEVYRVGIDLAITAGLTTIFTFSPAIGAIVGGHTNNNDIGYPLPMGPYLPRWTIGSITTAIDTGDQWSQISIWYKQLALGYPPNES